MAPYSGFPECRNKEVGQFRKTPRNDARRFDAQKFSLGD
jgi:hypothetical protein